MSQLLSFINPSYLLGTFGLLGVIAIIFLETGAFFGFFLPGDSLLFTAGFFASQHLLDIGGIPALPLLLIGSWVAAVAGDTVAYAFGKKVGPALFTREDSKFFNRKHIARAEHFYEKHGKKTIILARFLPIIRTFAPIVAGIGQMSYRTFISFNIVGGLLWTALLIIMGYIFGSIIPHADKYVLPVVLVIIVISVIPPLREFWRARRL